MLVVGSKLLENKVLSIHTGGEVAKIVSPIINPANLAILAYKIKSPLLDTKKEYYLRLDEVRELSSMGFIIDALDETTEHGDVPKIDKVIDLHFSLLGMGVRDDSGKKLGNIYDYVVDTDSFFVQKLMVKRPLIQRFSETELQIHRTQIAEINNREIIVHSSVDIKESETSQVFSNVGGYVNPFRKPENSTD